MAPRFFVANACEFGRWGFHRKWALPLALIAGLLLVLAGADSAAAQANAANYAFSTTTTGSFTDMSTGTTQLIAPDQDDTASAATSIGFDFFFMGVRQTQFSVNSNGTIRFGATVISNTLYDPLAQAGQALISPYGADQRTHIGDGRVHFKVIGAAPNRTLVIEWLNMQSNFNAGGTSDLRYQALLTETTGTIEFVYGSMTLTAAAAADVNSNSPQFGLSSNNTVGTVGSITAAQGGAPAPTYNGASATPVNNLYVAGPVTVLTSATDGSRRTFLFTPPTANPPGGPLTFTGVTAVGMTLNWTDSANEVGYAIYSSTDGGINYTFVATAAQNATSFPATGLSPSTTYDWRVSAVTEGAVASLTGTQATNAPTPNASLGTGLWNTPGTWSTGIVPTASDAVTISAGHTVTIDTAAVALTVTVAGTGILMYEDTTARTLTVGGNVTVDSGGTFQTAVTGTQTGHGLSLAGNLVNNGTLDFSTNANTAGAVITFTGTPNTSFSGTGATTDIRQITLNKASSTASILELMPTNFTVQGVTTDSAGWLAQTNGTFKLSGTFTATNRVFTAAAYTIGANNGFWLNNPNFTVAGQAGSGAVTGLLRISQGTFNVGTAINNSIAFSAGSTVLVEGGAVNAAGRFGVAASTNAITYTQSGGIITVCTVGSNSTTVGCFDLGTGTGTINISGGTIVIQVASTAATGPRDYRNQAGLTGTTTTLGATVQFGNASTPAAIQAYDAAGVFPNVVVTSTSANHTLTLLAPAVFNNITRNITINAGATFNVGNNVFLFNGTTLTNNGTLTGNGGSTNFVWFDTLTPPTGPQTYNGSGIATAPITNLAFQNNVTFDPAVSNVVVGAIRLFAGSVTNSNKLTLGNGGATTGVVQIGNTTTPTAAGTFDVPFVFNLGTGGQTISYLRTTASRSTGPEVNPTRTLTSFTFDDNDPTHTLTVVGGNIDVNTTIALTNGRVITSAPSHLHLNGAGTVTRTTGLVDGPFRKTYAAAGSKNFEVGTANGFSPVAFNNVAAGAFPLDITAQAVQTAAPNIQGAVITRYWPLTAAGVTSADLIFTYLDPADLTTFAVNEANLLAWRLDAPGPTGYTNQGGTINTATNTCTVTGVTQFSDWTLAEPTPTPAELIEISVD